MGLHSTNESNRLIKITYFLYGILGGFYFSPRFNKTTKYTWLLLNIITFIIVNIFGCIGYIVTSESVNANEIVFTFLIGDIVLYTTIILPCITYYYNSELEMVLLQIENEMNTENSPFQLITTTIKKYNLETKITSTVVPQTIACFVSNFVCFFDMVLFYDEKKLHDLSHFVFPAANIDNIESLYEYSFISVIQILCSSTVMAGMVAYPTLFFIIAHIFYSLFINLSDRLERISKNLKKTTESTDESLKKFDQGKQEIFLLRNPTISQREYLDGITTVIQHHQQIISSVKLIKPFLEFSYSLFLIGTCIAQFFVLYIILSPDLSIYQKIRGISFYTIGTVAWYSFCSTGELFNEMNILLEKNVFYSCWYYITCEQRKNIYILLCQAQHSLKFKGFGFSPLRMTSFPICLRYIYSFTSVLRTTVNN